MGGFKIEDYLCLDFRLFDDWGFFFLLLIFVGSTCFMTYFLFLGSVGILFGK